MINTFALCFKNIEHIVIKREKLRASETLNFLWYDSETL